ncbi:hypothetical protein E8E12_003451 [Didymella heteroderae]|uniref:Uncharacterized protein n=1 Tax=Didymella heteroderae TaxID=1769908 RepID=A0A9P5C5L1_9PLEO|nr:hypothetical protein E8E12_003451 [Didymella heteroderae]
MDITVSQVRRIVGQSLQKLWLSIDPEMTARQQYRPLTHTPELSLSDTENSFSSDEEMPDREETDQLLRQAHHYVITEGGEDSPSTYMERIQRINEDLVQEISAHGYNCDHKLFRRVEQKIGHVLREFEDAVVANSSLYDYSDSPEYYAAAAEEGLYRMDSSPVMPEAPSARRTAKIGGKDDVERTYLYGSPGNPPESWYKKAPVSLPFPETIRMADWESLRIHWDLATTGNMEKTVPVTGNAVSFDDPRLKHHNNLHQYESGSRFKLPTPSSADMKKVKEFGSASELRGAMKALNEGDDSKRAGEDGDYKYAPRVSLERVDMGQQNSPAVDIVDQVRSAVNTTPIKLRSLSNDSNKTGSARPATRAFLNDMQCFSPQSKPTAKTSAMRRVRAKMEDSLRSEENLSSAPATWETKEATHVAFPKKTRARPRKDAKSPAATSAYQVTATGKRKRLSADAIEGQTEDDFEYEAVLSQRRKLARESVRPCTPTLPVGNVDLNTPTSLPALTPGSSVMSTPPAVKARAAGKKQRKIRTKRDFEQRVSPEKYDEIMAGRRTIAAAAESIVRGSTRSGKVRRL